MRDLTLFLLTFFISLFPLTPPPTHAESITVSLQVGSTLLTFSGYTSPSALVVIKEDGSVVGTTTSNAAGDWTHTLTVAVPSLHSYSLSATDTLNRQTSAVSYNLNVVGNTTTTVDHIVLPPTLSVTGTQASGAGYPNSSLTLTLSSGNTTTLALPSTGLWSYDLSTLSPGTYTFSATNTVGSYLSLESTAVSYSAPASSPSPTPTPSSSPTSLSSSPAPASSPCSSQASDSTPCSPSPTPSSATPSPSPTPTPFFIPLYDENADGRLNLSELATIIKNWISHHLPCDLNRDQQCNLIDLSILLYYFER